MRPPERRPYATRMHKTAFALISMLAATSLALWAQAPRGRASTAGAVPQVHADLNQPPRHQTFPPVIVRGLFPNPIQLTRRLALPHHVKNLRRLHLHSIRQLVRLHSRRQFGLGRMFVGELRVPLFEQIEPRALPW